VELFKTIVEQSLLFFPFTLGIYLSFCILRTTDMTTEGSFVLGAGVFARLAGLNPFLGLAMAMGFGALAGLGVSRIQAHEKINSLMAGIIGLFILYSVNFQVMGRPNISLMSIPKISPFYVFSLIAFLTVIVGLLMLSRVGLLLRAFGTNQSLLGILGKNVEGYRMLGLALSNALAALCGALTAQVNGYADLGMGFGMTLTGISAVVIGQRLMTRFFRVPLFNIAMEIFSCFLGVMIYFVAINMLLSYGVNPIYLKCVLGFVLIFLLRGR
jgi:putative ABC transport system permease protein